MRFHVSCQLEYTVAFPSTLILNVHAQRNTSQAVLDERFVVEPHIDVKEFNPDGSGTRFVLLKTGGHQQVAISYSAQVDCAPPLAPAASPDATSISELSGRTIPFLFPSRYCQSDRLNRLAWDLFGRFENPHEQATAIADWVYENVLYLPGSTDSTTSAYDTVTQRAGVCRDFAHLGIALCRALNIPARYLSGYAYLLEPPDFHACFECFIGGIWVVFDPTRLAHPNGLVRIGMGRDAADAAVASIFGNAFCTRTAVSCTLAEGQNFVALDREPPTERSTTLAPSS